VVAYVRDRTGRFHHRPHYEPAELDGECEKLITAYLNKAHGEVRFPVHTEDLKNLVESRTESLDVYADLAALGPTVEGVTEFRPGKKPRVFIASHLTADHRRENRLRTTLTHEFGHVHFHTYLWDLEPTPSPLLTRTAGTAHKIICRRETILDAKTTDWMEWQAGYVCGAILMPKSAVTALGRQHAQASGRFGPAQVDSPDGLDLIAAVKTAFQVSGDAARIRLLKLQLLTDSPNQPLFG
jgi:hypothetical protein